MNRNVEAKWQIYTMTALREILFMEKTFLREPEEEIRKKVLEDFMVERAELEVLEGRLEDLLYALKIKNPWLFLLIQNAFKEPNQRLN